MHRWNFTRRIINTIALAILVVSFMHAENTQLQVYYGNINASDFIKITSDIYAEIGSLDNNKKKQSEKVVWELYEFLNKNNLDLTEEDFWNLLYEYLEWDLTIKKLIEDFNVPKELSSHISTKLLFWQEINNKKLKKQLIQLEEQAKIKWITAEIQKKSAEIQKNLTIIEEEKRKQEKEKRKQEEEKRKQDILKEKQKELKERSKASKKWKKDLDDISNKFNN